MKNETPFYGLSARKKYRKNKKWDILLRVVGGNKKLCIWFKEQKVAWAIIQGTQTNT